MEDEDAKAMIIDGVPSIKLSDRVHQYIAKHMARTVIVKLLGRKISYFTMVNKLQAIWRTSHLLQIIDLENDYFSVKFRTDKEYLEALAGGPWTIFGHYLTVRPWTSTFSTDQIFPSSLLVWIRLPGLPEGMYTKSLLRFIRNVVGTVAKIDRNTGSTSRGKSARLAVFIDLIFKVQIDRRIQRVEYESLPLVCFECGRFRHRSDLCPQGSRENEATVASPSTSSRTNMSMKERVEGEKSRDWMIVKRRQ